jgi:hypothetical protein
MGKCIVVVTFLGFFLFSSAWGQQARVTVPSAQAAQPATPGPFSLEVAGNVYLPLADSMHDFGFGAGEEVSLGYQVPGTVLIAFGGLTYGFVLARFSAPTVGFAAAQLGFGIRLPLVSILAVSVYATGGYWYGAFYDNSSSSANPYAGAGLELQIALSPVFALSLGTQYKDYFGLWQGITAGVGMKIGFEGT